MPAVLETTTFRSTTHGNCVASDHVNKSCSCKRTFYSTIELELSSWTPTIALVHRHDICWTTLPIRATLIWYSVHSSPPTLAKGNSKLQKTCNICTCAPASHQTNWPSSTIGQNGLPITAQKQTIDEFCDKENHSPRPSEPLPKKQKRTYTRQKIIDKKLSDILWSLTRQDGCLWTFFILSDTRMIMARRFTASKPTPIQYKSVLLDISIGNPQTSLILGFTPQIAVLMRIKFLCIQ